MFRDLLTNGGKNIYNVLSNQCRGECGCLAKGGKHLNTRSRRKTAGSRSGAHLSAADRAQVAVNRTRRNHRRSQLRTGAPQMLIMLLMCLFMISPLRGCILSDGDFIGYSTAQEIAFGDAGIAQDKAKGVSSEMIKLDGRMCYKVQFSGSVTDYRYIIDASTGDVLAQNFYRIEESGN